MEDVEIRHFHFFAGLGGGARGFNRGRAQVNNLNAKFRCIGGIDVSAAAIRDFNRMSGARGTVLDMFDREQYEAFHGHKPPADWREATPADIHAAAGHERPHIVFLSAPCKGFSGLLSETRSKTNKYQALNRLTLRGMWLMFEAWADDPPELILFENVPRIASRGRGLLDQIGSLARHYGYALAETTHDCGELGGLAQSRKRFLMVMRHTGKVPAFLYEPPKRKLKAVGDVLSRFPMPGDVRGGPMHLLPNLQWKTWVRLAFVEAGSDWRSLNKLRIADGHLQDFALCPSKWYGDTLGVLPWDGTAGVVTGMASPTRGAFSVADPRFAGGLEYSQYGVKGWDETSGTVTSQRAPGQGAFSVADPRFDADSGKYSHMFRVVPFEDHAPTVTSSLGIGQCVADPRPPSGKLFSKYMVTRFDRAAGTVIGGHDSGAYAVADPRPGWQNRYGNLAVCDFEQPCGTVIAGGKGVQGGWLSVADPRPGLHRVAGDDYLTGGHYGVTAWDEPSGAVSASAGCDNGRWSVADPRTCELPAANEKLVALIRSIDGTWHRPFTTLELAALQSLVDPDDIFDLDGEADGAKRERIGNAVPPDAAQAIADMVGQTLLLQWSGQSFALSSLPIWVQPVAVAMSVKTPEVCA